VPQGTTGNLAVLELLSRQNAESRKRKRRTTRRRWLMTVAIVLAVAGYLVWRSGWTVSVQRANVVAYVQSSGACAATIDFAGTIDVGGVGQIRYQWVRSDGTRSAVERRNVLPGQSTVTTHLFWAFSGPGRYRATARLDVWGSGHVQGRATATYDCP
jgi:hypothetical protein